MAHEEAVAIVQSLHQQLAGFARGCVSALADRKVSAAEGMQLSMQALLLGSSMQALLQRATPTVRNDILWVLEHGRLTLPEEEES